MLCEGHSEIECMQMDYCSRVGDVCIEYLAEHLAESLTSLTVTRNFHQKCAKISDAAIETLKANCPYLTVLKIEYTRKLCSFAEPLSALSALEQLHLPHCTIQGSIEPLLKLPQLQILDLSGDSWISNKLLKIVG